MVSPHPWLPGSIITQATSTPIDPGSGVVGLLVVDHDEVASARLAVDLRPLRHEVSTVESVDAAVSWLEARSADVVVLFSESREVALEGAMRLRSVTALPLIVVAPNRSAENRVGAFDRGAADYIVAPVHPAELDRRVRVLVRREQFRPQNDELLGPEGLVMHVRAHEVHVGAERLSLTPREFSIVRLLLERRGEVVVPDEISAAIWGHGTLGSRNYIEAHISRLRGKLSRAGTTAVIQTVRGVGYVIR